MNKCHININWQNNTTPAINETNLNYMDGCIDTLDDRVISLDTTKADEADLLTCVSGISYNVNTGILTITLKNGTSTTIDTGLAKLAVNFDYDDDPTSPHYEQLILTMADGTHKYVDLSALITVFEFDNSSTISFTVGDDGHVAAAVIDGSITAAKLHPDVMAAINLAEATAVANALRAEGFAVGEQDSSEVGSDSPYYQNNSKSYARDSEAWAKGSRGGTDVDPLDETYHNNSEYYADQAAGSASAAAQAKEDADDILDQVMIVAANNVFSVNYTTGELEYTNNVSYTFAINTTTGNLEWEVVA